MDYKKLFSLIDGKEDNIISDRRWLHQHPELSFQEKETSQYIINHYKGKGVKIEKNIGGYGIKVTIDSGKPGKTVGIRADMAHLRMRQMMQLL